MYYKKNKKQKKREMKEVQVGPKKDDAVLVAKVDGKYYCISNKCSHYGAPYFIFIFIKK